METITITCIFNPNQVSTKEITKKVQITLDENAPMTDFSDAAWEKIGEMYPTYNFICEG